MNSNYRPKPRPVWPSLLSYIIVVLAEFQKYEKNEEIFDFYRIGGYMAFGPADPN